MICISASTKFKKEILEISQELKKLNIPHSLPVMDHPKDSETAEMTRKYIKKHLKKIQESEISFIINPGGYIGNSVLTEIGYAQALNKKIYYLEKTNKTELDYFADGFISINELDKLKNI